VNEIEYEKMQESAAIGQALSECVNAIMAEHDATTLYGLQRAAYKYTDCGPSVGFKLFDGSYLWNGDNRANDPSWVAHVQDICISSIVEGSDAEVPPVWLNLLGIADNSDRICEKHPDKSVGQLAVRRWYDVLKDVNDEACSMWHEANDESDDEEAA
jgi:hypothetical protein